MNLTNSDNVLHNSSQPVICDTSSQETSNTVELDSEPRRKRLKISEQLNSKRDREDDTFGDDDDVPEFKRLKVYQQPVTHPVLRRELTAQSATND